MELFKLFGSIFIKDAEANKQLDNMEKKAGGLGDTLKGMGKTAAKWGAGLSAAAGVAGAGMAALVGNTLEATNEINKFSQVTGMTKKGFQEWDYVMKNFGYSAEQASGDLAALGEKAMDAANGVGEGAELFGMLGVQVTDASGKLKTQEQIFNETITALQGMEDVTRRNAIASALLSTTGEELVPVLNMTKEELQGMKSNANVISNEDLAKAEEFKKAWNKAKNTLANVSNTLGVALMPLFQSLLDWVSSNMPLIQKTFSTVFGVIGTLIDGAVKLIKGLIDWVKSWSKENEKELGGIGKIFKDFFKAIYGLIEAFIKWAVDIWDKYGKDITKIFKAAFDLVATTLKTAFKILTDLFNIFAAAFRGDWKGVWDGVKSLFSNAWNGIGSVLRSSLNMIKTTFSSWANMFKGAWSSVWDGLGRTVDDVWNGITGGMRSMVNAVISGINSMIRKVVSGVNNMIRGMNKVPGVDISTIRAPRIPRYAEGTDNHPGGLALVGEKGAELVNLPKGAKVYTNEETNDMLSGGAMNFEKMFEGANFYVRDDLDIKKIAEEIQNLTLVRRRGLGTL